MLGYPLPDWYRGPGEFVGEYGYGDAERSWDSEPQDVVKEALRREIREDLPREDGHRFSIFICRP